MAYTQIKKKEELLEKEKTSKLRKKHGLYPNKKENESTDFW